MSTDLEFTGERFVPGVDGEIVYEHLHRYAFARALCAGKRVLDAACGEGYGSALLAAQAAAVSGIDIDARTLAHARERYAAIGNLGFIDASATQLPLADASVELIVSFETVEHLPAHEQPRMLAEFARVLVTDGLLLLSAPNRVEYSDRRGFVNPFHRHEHDRAELDRLLAGHFPARAYFRQRMWMGSTIWSEKGDRSKASAYVGDSAAVTDAQPPEAMYYIVLAAKRESALPRDVASLSLFSDTAESELTRAYQAEHEAIRLDGILVERTAMLDKKTGHVEHLERLVALRDGVITERDGQLEQQALLMLQSERQNLTRDASEADARREIADLRAQLAESQATAAAQERIIDDFRSRRWWRMPWLPWLRWRDRWQRKRGE